MTHQEDNNPSEKAVEQLIKNGWGAISELIRIFVNQALHEERAHYLQAGEYHCTEERIGYANGYKPKTIKTRVGEITFSIPQVREGGFYPSALEKGLRSERALTMTLAEMYVQGVSTRRVKEITEQLCGFEISAAQVSRATAQLDTILQEWRERLLGEITYLYLDARYEKVRESSQVWDAAVLVATGIDPAGERQVLGVSVSLSGHETHWKAFLKALSGIHNRGRGIRFLINPNFLLTTISRIQRLYLVARLLRIPRRELRESTGLHTPNGELFKDGSL